MKQYQDLKYKSFIERLIPTYPKDKILGIRMPIIRELAKKTDVSFLDQLPHRYHEENLCHAIMINQIKDEEECLKRTKEFLSHLDNWAVVDVFYPRALFKNKKSFYQLVNECLESDDEYIVRFGLNLLRVYDIETGIDKIVEINHSGYYVQMMQAWLVCDGLISYWDKTIKLIESRLLHPWVHQKSIQKGFESRRLSTSQKDYLRTLRI